MAVLRIDIQGNPKAIPYRSFIRVANNSLAILDDLDAWFSRRRAGAVQWFMNDLAINGKLRLEIYSQPKQMVRKKLPDVAQDVTRSFVTGFRTLENEGRSPSFLSDTGMHRAEMLTDVLGHDGAKAIVAVDVSSEQEVEITKQSATNIAKLIPAAARSIGSIEGTLEEISVHRGNHFVVYQALTGKGVRCHFPKLGFLLDKAKENLSKRVVVSGVLARNTKNEPVRITIERESDFKVFGVDLTVMALKDLGGKFPDWTGDLSTEDFIRSVRE
jgi:hypothetical protein